MNNSVALKNRNTGKIKQVSTKKYSYVVLFWGALAPLFKGLWIQFLMLWAFNIVLTLIGGDLHAAFLIALGDAILAYFYNQLNVKFMLSHNWEPLTDSDKATLKQLGLV